MDTAHNLSCPSPQVLPRSSPCLDPPASKPATTILLQVYRPREPLPQGPFLPVKAFCLDLERKLPWQKRRPLPKLWVQVLWELEAGEMMLAAPAAGPFAPVAFAGGLALGLYGAAHAANLTAMSQGQPGFLNPMAVAAGSGLTTLAGGALAHVGGALFRNRHQGPNAQSEAEQINHHVQGLGSIPSRISGPLMARTTQFHQAGGPQLWPQSPWKTRMSSKILGGARYIPPCIDMLALLPDQ